MQPSTHVENPREGLSPGTSTFAAIRNSFGPKVLNAARRWEKLARREAAIFEQVSFLHSCFESNLIPRSLRIKPPVNTRQARKAAWQYGRAMLKAMIQNGNYRLESVRKQLAECSSECESLLDDDWFDLLHKSIDTLSMHYKAKRKAELKTKLEKIKSRVRNRGQASNTDTDANADSNLDTNTESNNESNTNSTDVSPKSSSTEHDEAEKLAVEFAKQSIEDKENMNKENVNNNDNNNNVKKVFNQNPRNNFSKGGRAPCSCQCMNSYKSPPPNPKPRSLITYCRFEE